MAINLDTTHRAQRRHVFVLAFALCVWLFAYATHVHFADESSETKKPACSFCLMFPGGAAPAPAAQRVPPPAFHSCVVVDDCVASIRTRAVPSFYLSRAPPAL